MEAKAIGTLLSIVAPILTFLVWALPNSKISRVLRQSFGPSPSHLETRSAFLWRRATYAAAWLLALVALSFGFYASVENGLLHFESDTAFIVVSFFLASFIGIASLTMLGAGLWGIVLRLFGRDSHYVLENNLPPEVLQEMLSHKTAADDR